MLYRFLAKIKKTLIFLYANSRLRYIYKISRIGKNVTLQKGFTVFNGSANIKIGNNVSLNDVVLNAGDTRDGEIIIEDDVFFGHKCMVLARTHDYIKSGIIRQTKIYAKRIIIEKGAWIASGAIILGGVRIGKNAVVGAGAVVTKNVKANTIVGGVPAKLIKEIEKYEK